MEDGSYLEAPLLSDMGGVMEAYQERIRQENEGDNSFHNIEYVGPQECWEKIGMRIRWTIPDVPGRFVPPKRHGASVFHIHDPLVFKLCLECRSPVPIRQVTACAWTHLFHANNHEGTFKEIRLQYDEKSRTWDDNGVTCYEFQATVFPTTMEHFRLTFNVRFSNYVIWVNKLEEPHVFTVHNIRSDNKLVSTEHQVKVTKNISMGNYLCSLLADEMGYDVVLNLDNTSEEQMKRSPNPDFIKVIRLFSQVSAGGGNQIPQENIRDMVKWLKQHNGDRQKVLVSDKNGVGRTASALTAYVYANNPNLSYDEAYQYVARKCPGAFCHKGLRDIVTWLYPRD